MFFPVIGTPADTLQHGVVIHQGPGFFRKQDVSILMLFNSEDQAGAAPGDGGMELISVGACGDGFSELYFQQKLELTRRARSYRSCIQGQIYQAEVGRRNEAIRAGILRTVENVEHFRSKLNLCSFSDRKNFGHRRINLPDPGTAQEIARDIAES